jgi:predicted GNAT superfamily acetyltransferase
VSSVPATVEVRDVAGPGELRACQRLQKRTWGITEDGYLVPVATLAAAQKMGGAVLGAFRGDELLGFTFAVLGRYRGGEPTLYSQLAAIDPAHQGGGIGRQLKLAQRERARGLGLGSVTWTFDPLQAGNAAFNLVSLGARGIAYETDLYGNRSDALNAGLATDRLVVQWPTTGELGGESTLPADALEPRADTAFSSVLELVEAPLNVGELKRSDPERAQRWQRSLREQFTAAFASGYLVTGFVRDVTLGRAFYLLRPKGREG